MATPNVARAACSTPDYFSTANNRGLSIVRTGDPVAFPDDIGDTVTDKAFGCFWSCGHGDPVINAGSDAGTRCAYAVGAADTWWEVLPGEPSYLGNDESNWSIGGIDGCIRSDSPHPQCMVVLLTDDSNGVGYFALLSDEPNSENEYELNSTVAPNETILLRPSPGPTISSWWRTSSTSTRLTATLELGQVPADAIYNNCPLLLSNLIVGFHLYYQERPAGGPAPIDRDVEIGGWTPLATVPFDPNDPAANPEDVVPMGTHTFDATCSGDRDLYFCATLAFESGFETRYCSANALPEAFPPVVRCGNCAGAGDCDDGNTCTTDTCGGGGDCQHTYPACNPAADGCCAPGCLLSNDPDCGPGAVPDGGGGGGGGGGGVPGAMLVLDKAYESNDVELSWGASCLAGGHDYAIYEGTLGNFASHAQKSCSTQGLTRATISPGGMNHYYLVVARSPENAEGSYGTGHGGERARAASPCVPTQELATCNP